MNNTTARTGAKKSSTLKLAVNNDPSAREAGLRWRGEQALANMRLAREKLTRMVRDEAPRRISDEDYEIMISAYAEVLDALSVAEESIEATYAPAEHFRIESEQAALAKAGAR